MQPLPLPACPISLTFVVLEKVIKDLAVRGFVESQTGVAVVVGVVVLHERAIAGAVEHDPVLSVVVNLSEAFMILEEGGNADGLRRGVMLNFRPKVLTG